MSLYGPLGMPSALSPFCSVVSVVVSRTFYQHSAAIWDFRTTGERLENPVNHNFSVVDRADRKHTSKHIYIYIYRRDLVRKFVVETTRKDENTRHVGEVRKLFYLAPKQVPLIVN